MLVASATWSVLTLRWLKSDAELIWGPVEVLIPTVYSIGCFSSARSVSLSWCSLYVFKAFVAK